MRRIISGRYVARKDEQLLNSEGELIMSVERGDGLLRRRRRLKVGNSSTSRRGVRLSSRSVK